MQHARLARTWLTDHCALFLQSVDIPWAAEATDEEIVARFQPQLASGCKSQDLRDNLLFNFHNSQDLLLFMRLVRTDLKLPINICLDGENYIENNTANNSLDDMPRAVYETSEYAGDLPGSSGLPARNDDRPNDVPGSGDMLTGIADDLSGTNGLTVAGEYLLRFKIRNYIAFW